MPKKTRKQMIEEGFSLGRRDAFEQLTPKINNLERQLQEAKDSLRAREVNANVQILQHAGQCLEAIARTVMSINKQL